ncbi:hypothetical protein SHM_07970 [Spiroplasma ixodetis]|uniref:Uncharacterized protein n=1 Tax=Spiroplasma ixodetis TaxID=2141 RepID=A0ABM8BTH2_9MOLU|nr:hypothetical protein SHM_07970 [Spiroplasma ixodetis]
MILVPCNWSRKNKYPSNINTVQKEITKITINKLKINAILLIPKLCNCFKKTDSRHWQIRWPIKKY